MTNRKTNRKNNQFNNYFADQQITRFFYSEITFLLISYI